MQGRYHGEWENATSETGKQPVKKSIAERFSQALASIGRRAPSLTYLGLGCWIVWNTIAFSRPFWLHETDSGTVTENLMLVHLLARFITLSVIAAFADQAAGWIPKNRTTLVGGIIACVGTFTLRNARAEVLGDAIPAQY